MRPSHEGQGVQLCHAAWWLKPAAGLSRPRGLQRRSSRTGHIRSLVCPAVSRDKASAGRSLSPRKPHVCFVQTRGKQDKCTRADIKGRCRLWSMATGPQRRQDKTGQSTLPRYCVKLVELLETETSGFPRRWPRRVGDPHACCGGSSSIHSVQRQGKGPSELLEVHAHWPLVLLGAPIPSLQRTGPQTEECMGHHAPPLMVFAAQALFLPPLTALSGAPPVCDKTRQPTALRAQTLLFRAFSFFSSQAFLFAPLVVTLPLACEGHLLQTVIALSS